MVSSLQQFVLGGQAAINPAIGAPVRRRAAEQSLTAQDLASQRAEQVIEADPLVQERAQQQLEINRQTAENARVKTLQESAKFEREGRALDIEDDERTSRQLAAVTDEAQWNAWKANNPIDSKGLENVTFGTPEFAQAQAQASGIVAGLLDLKQDTALTNIGKINEDLAAGRVTKEQATAAVNKITSVSKGTRFQFNPETGAFEFSQGGVVGDGGVPFPTGAAGRLGEDILAGQGVIEQVSTVIDRFDPKFLQIPARIGFVFDEIGSKLGFDNLNTEERAELREYSLFKRSSAGLFNQILNDASGKTVTKTEMDRKKPELPIAGIGILDGDAPDVFLAKAKDFLGFMKRADVRKNHALRTGVNFNTITLSQMDDIINARGKELIDDGMTKEQAKIALKEEFGI